ncbi:MAG: hypothetical protein NWE75_00125 [Candidatus Bathyarchaeota archaeon]|nr:hypothetical protein [Candidatus Bathyarchaeota archaeon]
MPTASIDFTLSAFAMIVIVIGAINGINMAAEPYMGEGSHEQGRYINIGKQMLLSQGEPTNWGTGGTPSVLGLASGGEVYELDIDKVTRLNPSNANAVNYSSLWSALGVDDVSFRIEVAPLFDITLNLTSSQNQGGSTVYNFSTSTTREGYPLQTQVSYHIAVRNSTYSSTGSTDDGGGGSVQFTLPNSNNGTAMLVGIAKAEESMVGYAVLPFAHNSTAPEPVGTFATLSPFSYSLSVDLSEGATAWNAAVFSFDYSFNLTKDGTSYSIPRLLDGSPMILTLTGVNASSNWAEWVAYPQVPLETGAEMMDDYVVSDVAHTSFVVEIKGTFYRFDIAFRSPAEYG